MFQNLPKPFRPYYSSGIPLRANSKDQVYYEGQSPAALPVGITWKSKNHVWDYRISALTPNLRKKFRAANSSVVANNEALAAAITFWERAWGETYSHVLTAMSDKVLPVGVQLRRGSNARPSEFRACVSRKADDAKNVLSADASRSTPKAALESASVLKKRPACQASLKEYVKGSKKKKEV